jgi:CubicO group peptidase (beta-lactamase class C family)
MCADMTKIKSSLPCYPAAEKLAAISLDQGADAALFWHNGELLWNGPNLDESFYVWSMTKSFTSVCCGLMVDAGLLDLDVPAMRWLPEFEKDYPTVTLRHLLTFTSGLFTDELDPFKIGAPRYSPGAQSAMA